MPKNKRVGAISHSEDDTFYFFGYGVYEGEHPVPTEGDDVPGGWMGEMLRESQVPNPRIRLDNGDVIWGCECWWGPEEVIKKKLEGKKIVDADIKECRRECAKAEAEAGEEEEECED